MQLEPGEPVDLKKIADSRRKLYDTGAFAAVDIVREDTTPAGEVAEGADHAIRLRVKVQEVVPINLRYGAYYDTERSAGGMVDISYHNFLGGARVLGLRARYDSQLHEVRLNFSEPFLMRLPVKTVFSTYARREIYPETDLASGFDTDRLGLAVQQEATLPHHLLLNYGYRIEQTHTYDTGPDPIFDVRLRIASLTSTLSHDTRDDVLDATRGSFMSHAFQLSAESMGSQVRFVKYSGQYFRYFALQKPRLELFTNEVLRPRFVYATAVRVGLGTGLGGQEIPLSERFFAGGSTTIRGFVQNSVGPTTLGTVYPGGNAMLVLNNEVRFPMIGMFDGVGFVDVGNVYRHVSDFSLSDLRSAAGFGLRVRTHWILLRVDYGFKLDRQPGESMGRLFFSIGQAF
jgi:outer membrane protein assembly factor BamA